MLSQTCQEPCRDVQDLQRDFNNYREKTDRDLVESRTNFAIINTKLNWLIGILGCIGAAVLPALIKLIIPN